MSDKAVCEVCGEGHVTAQVQMVENEYKGRKTQLPMHYKSCDTCTSDYVGQKESQTNRGILMAWIESNENV